MTRMIAKLIVASVALAGAAASASTTQAWQQLDRRVNRACIAASALTRAKIVEDKASFSDRVPVELRIVEGYNRGSVVDVKLCAFDRRTGRATTTNGTGRLGVNRN